MFTHLHVHTEYSLLDGLSKIEPLIAQTQALGMDALAITDHGALYGAIELYQAAKAAGVRPIIGCEAYLTTGESRLIHSPQDKNPYHIALLAKDEAGYRNLVQLVTKAHLEGFYYKPRLDRGLLEEHHQGLIALSACGQGELARLLLEGRQDEARAAARWYREVFGDFYLELQHHDIPELEEANRKLVALGRELGLPLVATNDVHYIHQADASAHDILLCIQTNTSIYEEKRPRMANDSFYLRSPQEMAQLFAELPQAIANTQRIAEACDLRLEFNRLHLPEVDLPPGMGPDDYLAQLCWDGLRRRYPEASAEAEARLGYELEVIRQTQFANYFLVVWDIVSFTRRRGILFGVRGSAAGSIVLYCLGVTDIDPLPHRLVFERFLNVERRELPDIDMDFADDRRDEVIAYVTQKYGPDHVAQIITFGTLGARAALRDVGRALGLAYGEVDRVARLVPPAPNITLSQAMAANPELSQLYHEDETIHNLIETAQRLEGTVRHASTHAAGVVISKDPLVHHVPLQRPTRGGDQETPMTQFAMEPIAQIGLLKMDLLGLGNLTILSRARDLIAQSRGVTLDLPNLPLDDTKTYQMLASGETTGVFQLESAGMRRYIKELRPSTFGDIAAMVALYRPGPMQHIPTFIRAKYGQEEVRYPHPILAPILEETYGVIVYQDQVLLIAQALAGYSLGQADVVRKAMGKKIPEVMREERSRFRAGAQAKGFSPEVAEAVFDLIEPFAGYAFNKAHSVSYALIAYQTAYLKANYPAEYMAAMLSVVSGAAERVAAAVAECRRLDVPVLPPDLNRSQIDFTIERRPELALSSVEGPVEGEAGGKTAIRFGLSAIKNVGAAALQPILAERERGGPFASLEDFCRRTDLRGLNKRVVESLVKAGALDCLGPRGALVSAVDRIMALSAQEQRRRQSGQATMFDLWGEAVPTPFPSLDLGADDLPLSETLAWEKELLGVYLSEHPFARAAQELREAVTAFCGQIGDELTGQAVVVAGMVAQTRPSFTKERKAFLSATIEDLDGSLEVTVWPEVYSRTRDIWVEGNIVLVRGKVRARGDRVQVIVDGATPYEPGMPLPSAELRPTSSAEPDAGAVGATGSNRVSQLLITLREGDDSVADMSRLKGVLEALERFPGPNPVRLVVESNGQRVPLRPPRPTAGYCSELREELVALVGEAGLMIERG